MSATLTTVYVVNGVGVATIKEVKELLGDTDVKVTRKAIEAGKVPGVTITEVPEGAITEVEELTDTEEPMDEVDEEIPLLTPDEDEVSTDTEEDTDTPSASTDVDYPEVGHFKDKEGLKKYYKKLPIANLEEWVELEGLEVEPTDSEPIYRMRLCMAILYHHFPKPEPKSKKKSKYGDYTTEQLMELALEHDVEVKDAKGNMQILRMYAIMALREAGVLK